MNPATRMMIEKLQELALQGRTYQQAADLVGATYHSVASYARKYDIPLRHLKRGAKPKPPDARSEDMRAQYLSGRTLEEIGQQYGITRERVRQVMTKHYGMRGANGGKAERSRKRRREFQKKRDARMMRAWGCSYRDYQKILKHPDKPTLAYAQQRNNANFRGVGWELNLWQWWKAWEQSGHWPERGNGKGYCMCRLNDTGPYAVDNVYIATGTDNMKDYWVKRRATIQVAA